MEPNQEQTNKWRLDPNNWKWHMFYFNKEDSRLLVDKPNPNYGVTFNFASPKAYMFLLGMICFFGFIIYLIEKNGR